MASKKIQLYTDRDKTIEASPETSANCVILSDGNDLQKVLDNDLTNPTVVHEETSFKVGVGDIDVSSSVVDGEVGRMVIKGKTYQNILPEPSTHVLSNNKEMFKVNEGLDSNVEIVDAVSKSAILRGQTRVNEVLGGIHKNVSLNGTTMTIKVPTKILKTNTTYWFSMNVISNTCVNGADDTNGIYMSNGKPFNGWTSLVNTNGNKLKSGAIGRYFSKLTTANDLTGIDYVEFFASSTIGTGSIEINNLFICEVDGEESLPNYFEGMQSVKLPVLSTVGKNLLDPSSVELVVENDNSAQTVTYNSVTDTYEFLCPKSFNQMKIMLKNLYKVTSAEQVYVSGTCESGGEAHEISRRISVNEDKISIEIIHNWSPITKANLKIMITDDNKAITTAYEPFKSNILTVNEEVELRGIGGVKDELNCLTGEVTQNIYQITLTGDESGYGYSTAPSVDTDFHGTLNIGGANLPLNKKLVAPISNRFQGALYGANKTWQCCIGGSYALHFFIPKTELETSDINGFKNWVKQQYLSGNPIKVAYILEEKSIKTVDLSSSGNWEKVVLDGSERWMPHSDNGSHVEFKFPNEINNVHSSRTGFSNKFPVSSGGLYERIAIANGTTYITVKSTKAKTVEQLQLWLSQNPITVWYQTTSHKDSTQVKQPIFFKDGHVQLSSGTDNSLIPTLDYQAKTSNSYVMDLMKTNTKYTMKAKSASGTFTIDGTSYGTGTNGTFTTPSSMTNKLLVMSNKTNEEVMILEGDVVSKTIPYFKGIKSAFEGESKIEVLSTGKNLFDMNRRYDKVTNAQATVIQNIDEITVSSAESGTYVNANFVLDKNFFKGKTVVGSCLYESDEKNIGTVQINYQDTTGKKYYQSIKTSKTFTFPDEFVGEVLLCVYANNTNTPRSNTVTVKNIQIELGTKSTTYDSHKSNVSKIPLLSPLRSLPNGVCDELIIDRMKKKATLIKRIDKIVFDGKQRWLLWDNNPADVVSGYVYYDANNMGYEPKSFGYTINDRLPHNSGGHIATVEGARYTNYFTASLHKSRIGVVRVNDTTTNTHMVQRWYTENPMTMYYELAIPVVTEIDLENFPLVYKDGHIFLNSEIAPVVEINYNVNQAQLIQSNNETLQRHELDILDLDNLIVSFVNAEYNLRLLKFNMELSMMALAE